MRSRLILSVNVQGGFFSGFATLWPPIYKVLRAYLKGRGDFSVHADALSTGRPYHLPFSFENEEAKSIARDLKAAGCDVLIVPSE